MIKAPLIDYTKFINYTILIYAFCLSTSRAGISISIATMSILWIAQGDFKKKFQFLKDSKIIISFSLFILLGYLSLLWSATDNYSTGFNEVTKTFRLLLLPIIIISTTLQKEYIPKVLTAFLLGMLLSETLSYGIFFEIITPDNFLHMLSKHAKLSDPTPFMNHLEYSTFLAFTSLLLLHKIIYIKNFQFKLMYMFYFCFVVANLFINGGRTGQLAFFVALVVFIFIHIKNKLLAFFTMLLVSSSVFFIAYSTSPIFQKRSNLALAEINTIFDNSSNIYSGSFGKRLAVWVLSKDIVSDNLIFGLGAGGSEPAIAQYKAKHSNINIQKNPTIHSHNTFIEYTLTLGLVGLFLHLSLWYFILTIKIKHIFLSNLRIVFVVLYTTASVFEALFFGQFGMSLFALFVAVLISQHNHEQKEEQLQRTST